MKLPWINLASKLQLLLVVWLTWLTICKACTFHSTSEFPLSDTDAGKFVRIREDAAIGDVVFSVDAYPRKSVELRAIDRSSKDDKYFRLREVNSTRIQIILRESLDELVDSDTPHSILKFKIQCNSGSNRRNHDVSYYMLTFYVEDVNDNKPAFLNAPYSVTIDETTPFGSVVFQDIQAFDRDQPNTANSDIQYFISHQTTDSQGAFFMMDSPHRPHIILKRALDFDNGMRRFDLNIIAKDRGIPPHQTNTTLSIYVDDVDDLPPMFTHEAYYTKVKEFFTITGKSIHKQLKIDPPIEAFDQDSLNSTLSYSIISGNDRDYFWMHPQEGKIYLKKEIDLEDLQNLSDNTFSLQIDVRQKNDLQKRALAKVEIEIIDINDNQPEFEVDLYNISIVENLPNGFSVLQVNAYDRDQGENSLFLYKIFKEDPAGAFSVDPQSGWMTVKNQTLLDRESQPTIKLLVQAVEKVPPYKQNDVAESTTAVEITLLDANDNSPQFELGNLYEFKVDVNASIGHVVGKIKAFDTDDGPNGKIIYEMKSRRDTPVPFKLDQRTGSLKVTGKLFPGRIALFVEACDQPINLSEQRCSLAVLTLDIVNLEDSTDIKFLGSPYEFWIGGNAPIGSSVGQIRTVYRDDIIFDLLHSYSEGVPFAIEEQSGIITVIRPITSFNRNIYNFEAVATYAHAPVEHSKSNQSSRALKKSFSEDLGFQVDEGIVSDLNFANMYIANVTINVVNSNSKSSAAVFMRNANEHLIEFHILENEANSVIGNLLSRNFTDMSGILQASSSSPTATIHRRPSSREHRQLMSSSKFRKPNSETKKNVTAIVTTPSSLGLIQRKSRNMFNTTSRKRPAISQKFNRVINLPPITLRGDKATTRSNDERPMSALSKYLKKSRTTRATKNVNFFIVNDYDVKEKMFVSNDGKLMTINGLDREEKDSYKLSVIAEYTNGLVDSAGIYQIQVIVDDVNDNPPKFDRTSYIGVIAENSPLGTEVMLNDLIIVNDADAGKNAEFHLSILGDGNRIFTIEKSDSVPENINSSSAGYNDGILDEYSNLVDINLQLMMLNTREMSQNQSHYVIKFSGPSLLDRERKNFYKLRLSAKDSGNLVSEADLMVFVTDVNDNPPVFEKLAVFKQTGIEIKQYTDKMEILFIDSQHNTNNNHRNHQPPISVSVLSGNKKPSALPLDAELIEIKYRKETYEESTIGTTSPRTSILPRYRNKPIGSPRAFGGFNNDEDEDDRIANEDRAFKDETPQVFNRNGAGGSVSKVPLFMIEESVEPGMTIMQLTATDDDYGPNSLITYEIVSEKISLLSSFKGDASRIHKPAFFSVDKHSGEIKVNRQLVPNVEVVIEVSAKDSAGLTDKTQIAIQISDVNNHPPQFLRPFYSFDIEEGFHVGKILGTIQAVDDDFEDNGNITYSIVNADADKFPFSITSKTGILKVSGQLDRELKSLFEFKIMARDNSRKYKQLNATVVVEVNIIDQNDNAPQFIGYDDMIFNEIPSTAALRARKLNSDLYHNQDILPQNSTPAYKINLDRNVSPRRLIREIKAIDIDYALNGMVFYNFLHNNISHLFEIDAREGLITTTPNPEHLKTLNNVDFMNLTVVASDLGNPVKSSYAMLMITMTGEKRIEAPKLEAYRKSPSPQPIAAKPILFINQYYELEVFENSPTPMRLIQFNTTNDSNMYKWSLELEGKSEASDKRRSYNTVDVSDIFSIADGILWLTKTLDREEVAQYTLKIRAEPVAPRRPRNGKSMQMMYPVTDDRIENLDENEVRVVVKVLDVNDHSPVFKENGPIIAVIPETVKYGYNVLKVQAEDEDTGINGDIRYSIINEPTNFFGIDALTGQIRALGPLWKDNQRIFGFDVKATDRLGADNGRYSIVNVLVYVLDDHKHVKFVMSGNTMDIEREAESISRSLSDASGLIVKIRMLEPHEVNREFLTNVYVYAIDPKTNTVVDMEELQDIMEQLNMQEINPSLPIIELTKLGVPAHLAPKIKQGSGELASIVLSITILIGGISTAICILCVRYKRQIQNAIAPVRDHVVPSSHPPQMIRQRLFLPQPVAGDCSSTDPVSDDTTTDVYAPVLKQLIPMRKNNVSSLSNNNIISNNNITRNNIRMSGRSSSNNSEKREYIDIPLPKSVLQINLKSHDANCARYNYVSSKNNFVKTKMMETSATIAECGCEKSDEHQDVSSNSTTYDDSLKEFAATETLTTSTTTRYALAHHRMSFRQNIYDCSSDILDRNNSRHSFSGFHRHQPAQTHQQQQNLQLKSSRRSSFMHGKVQNPPGFP